jgi:hypothetical protein
VFAFYSWIFYRLSCVVLIVSSESDLRTIFMSPMAGKDLAAAVNDVNNTKGSNAVPGSEDTEDNDERNSSNVSPNLIHQPASNEVTGDTQSIREIEEAARKRRENLLAARRDAKAEFEAQQKEVLDRVPEDYKKMFGKVGFIRWGDAALPALIVSPYSVPAGIGSPREQWLEMLNKVSALALVRNDSARSSRPSSRRNSVSRSHCFLFDTA